LRAALPIPKALAEVAPVSSFRYAYEVLVTTLPPSPEPPEALGKLANIGIAILRELFKGRASRGLDDTGVCVVTDGFGASR